MPSWHRAPRHQLLERGAYIVTAGIYQKQHLLCAARRLDMVRDTLFACAEEFRWELQAWAILSNHYHFVASSPDDPSTISRMISKLHTLTARELNKWDAQPGRKVWFQYYDTRITNSASYYARLKYVHQNPAHHKVVRIAENWPWCSAGWFAREANSVFRRLLDGIKTDRVNVADAFEPVNLPEEEDRAASSRRTPQEERTA
ncbi:MAG TPA: transposase [Kiritimatiellia bacterium]|nr:transposase [Kiritimatiellia bacterium]